MKRIHFPGIVALVLFISHGLLAGNLNAQQVDEHSHSAYYTCGSDWARNLDYENLLETTRQNNPVLYERMLAQADESKGAHLAGDDVFFVASQTSQGFQALEATLVYQGNDVLVWLADEYLSSIDQQTIEALAVGLEERVKEGPTTRNPDKGVIANDIDIFGEPVTDKWSDGEVKVHILLLNIASPIAGGVIEGYFSSYDQTSYYGSNERNLLYVDLKQLVNEGEDAVDGILGTIAHEFQHLINYSQYHGPSDKTHWIYNEGLSEVASIRNGYRNRDAATYLTSPNRFSYFDAPTGSGNADTILRGYERSMLWIHYLSERFGDEFLNKLVPATGSNLEPVRTAMLQTNNGNDAESVMGEFWAANYVQGTSSFKGDSQYRYAFPVSARSSTTVHNGGAPSQAETFSVDVLGYAAYYPRYASNNPSASGLKIRFASNNNPYKVHAVLFRSDNSIEVHPVRLDEDQVFTGFKNIIFAIANVSGSAQTIQWIAESANVSGVNDYVTGKSILAFTGIAPNPVRDEVRFSFQTPASGSVRFDLFDLRGAIVRQVMNDEGYAGGVQDLTLDLSSLPAGVYTARLQDASGSVAARQIVVVK